MNVKIEDSWRQHIGDEFEKQYFVDLSNFVREEYLHTPCYPPGRLIFNAFNLCPFDDVKVVIIGQDPYHEPGQAMGLSFSVPEGVTFPPSLMNIFKEIQMDLGIPMPATGDLTRWAKQGVLLLNATLTVRAHQLRAISARDGNSLRMLLSRLSAGTRSIWYLFFGEAMPAARLHSSTLRAI